MFQTRGAVCLVLRECRKLHIHLSTGQSLAKLEKEATHLSLGVGFVAAYAPNRSSGVWVQPFDTRSNVFAYTAGLNTFGQCGNSSSANYGGRSLSRVSSLAEKIDHVACGLDHTLFLTKEGCVFSCGWSADGQTGIDSYSSVSSPSQVHLPRHLSFSNIHTCADTSFACTHTGQVYGWGNNEYGQLGLLSKDKQVSKPVPMELSNLDIDGQLVSMTTGGAFSAFLTNSGSVYVAGYSIENPSLSHDKTGKLLHPHNLCSLKKLHDGKTSDGIRDIHAGLHYLVGEVSAQAKIVWGRYPAAEGSEQMLINSATKISLDHDVQSIAYGPTAIAAMFSENVTKPISFLS